MRMKTTRRDFLRASGAAGLFGLTGCAGFPAITSVRSPNSLLNHACVGTGNMALCDLKGLKSHPKLRIAALCDVDSRFLAKAAELCPGARLYRNAHEMLAAEGDRIDSVNVSTPDHTHAGYVIDALERGLNVYGQKPLCHELADCRRIEALAAKKGVVTQLGTQIAAHPCDRQTAQYLRSGVIGEVKKVWIFSNRGGQSNADHTWPLKPAPIPDYLDWMTWLGEAPFREYVPDVYHPFAWRRWRDFGTSWLGDLGLHLLSPVWIGLDLGATSPLAVTAKIPVESGEAARQYWPRNSHIVWEMPGIAATGGNPFTIEWCDGNIVERDKTDGFKDKFSNADKKLVQSSVKASMDPDYFPPDFFRDLFAKSPIGKQPLQGRVVEGSDGWLLSVHYDETPAVVLKNGKVVPPPDVGTAPTHWHEYVNCCFDGKTTTSSFAWAGRLSEMVLVGNAAMSRPGERIVL